MDKYHEIYMRVTEAAEGKTGRRKVQKVVEDIITAYECSYSKGLRDDYTVYYVNDPKANPEGGAHTLFISYGGSGRNRVTGVMMK